MYAAVNWDRPTLPFELRGDVFDDGDAGSKLREWSSLIGIVTAIVGNILISFALNIQRYAHIRLNRERIQRTESWHSGNNRKRAENSYGTIQEGIAEERAQLNLKAPTPDEEDTAHRRRYQDNELGNGTETSPLRSSLRSRRSSDSTIMQSEKKNPNIQSTTYLRSAYWWAGILLMTIGEAGNFLAYGFAPASIVSPLGVVALVSNCIIAPCLLKERFRQRDFWGVAIAVAGAVTVVLSAKTSETKMGPGDIWTAITRWEFELYLGITAAMMIVLAWMSGKYGEKTVFIDLGLVGLFGGYTALSTKGVASLLSGTLWRALTFPITYLLVFILITTAVLQIRYLNRALQRFNSTQVIPTQFVLFTLSVIIGSSILYRDFESATAERVAKFVGGCALTFLGVYLITSGRVRGNDADDDEEVQDEENAIGLVDEEVYEDEVGELHNQDGKGRRESTISHTMNNGDGPGDSGRASRRQSFGQPQTPRTPQRFHSHKSSASSFPFSPSVDDPDSPLSRNPWLTPQERLDQPHRRHPLQSTISSPVLPTEGQDSRPGTERAHTQSVSGPSQSYRPATISRNSISRIIPGPLISPLSSSLSGVVADSLRKGVQSPSQRRRRPSVLRKSRSQKLLSGYSEMETPRGTSPLKSVHAPGDASTTQESIGKGRSQSMSNRLGNFFSIESRRRKSKSDNDGGVEVNTDVTK